jgi:hypothetical protein
MLRSIRSLKICARHWHIPSVIFRPAQPNREVILRNQPYGLMLRSDTRRQNQRCSGWGTVALTASPFSSGPGGLSARIPRSPPRGAPRRRLKQLARGLADLPLHPKSPRSCAARRFTTSATQQSEWGRRTPRPRIAASIFPLITTTALRETIFHIVTRFSRYSAIRRRSPSPNRRDIVRLPDTFVLRDHCCRVMDVLGDDLFEHLRKTNSRRSRCAESRVAEPPGNAKQTRKRLPKPAKMVGPLRRAASPRRPGMKSGTVSSFQQCDGVS